MTRARYVRILEAHSVRFGLDGDHLIVVGCPREARHTLAAVAPQLVAYFRTGQDAELDVHRDFAALGLSQMENGRWTHPRGDDVADRLVAGVLAPDAPEDVPQGPRRVEVEAVEVSPGQFTWTETKGTHAVPVVNGHPLITR